MDRVTPGEANGIIFIWNFEKYGKLFELEDQNIGYCLSNYQFYLQKDISFFQTKDNYKTIKAVIKLCKAIFYFSIVHRKNGRRK